MKLQRYSFVKCETLKDPNGRWVLFEDLRKQRLSERALTTRQAWFVIVAAVLLVGLGAMGVYREGIVWGWW